MREVLEGMEDFSLQVAYLHADFNLPIVDVDVADGGSPRKSAEVIPFPRLRRASGE